MHKKFLRTLILLSTTLIINCMVGQHGNTMHNVREEDLSDDDQSNYSTVKYDLEYCETEVSDPTKKFWQPGKVQCHKLGTTDKEMIEKRCQGCRAHFAWLAKKEHEILVKKQEHLRLLAYDKAHGTNLSGSASRPAEHSSPQPMPQAQQMRMPQQQPIPQAQHFMPRPMPQAQQMRMPQFGSDMPPDDGSPGWVYGSVGASTQPQLSPEALIMGSPSVEHAVAVARLLRGQQTPASSQTKQIGALMYRAEDEAEVMMHKRLIETCTRMNDKLIPCRNQPLLENKCPDCMGYMTEVLKLHMKWQDSPEGRRLTSTGQVSKNMPRSIF